MYSIFEKITFGAVALGVTLLILFMNSTKDIQLGSALSETDPVVSQEVATGSDEAVEPEVGSTVDVVTEVVSNSPVDLPVVVLPLLPTKSNPPKFIAAVPVPSCWTSKTI